MNQVYHSWDAHNANLVKSRSSIKSVSVIQSFQNYIQSMAVWLQCSVQSFKPIRQLKQMLRTNVISWDLSLRCISGRYPTLSKAPGLFQSRWLLCICCHIWCVSAPEGAVHNHHLTQIWLDGTDALSIKKQRNSYFGMSWYYCSIAIHRLC